MVQPHPEQTQIVVDVAREMVASVAPEELPLYRLTSDAYARDPARAHRPPARSDDMLGFGEGVAAALAPVALVMAGEVVRFLGEELRKALREQSANAVSAAVKKLFGKLGRTTDSGGSSPPTLSARQLAEVRRRALEKARQFRLPQAQADQLADALVAQLATSAG